MKRLFVWFIVAVSFLPASALAQDGGRVTGLVIDSATNKQVEGASVTLEQADAPQYTTKSDLFGRYEFKDVTAGKYTLKVVHPAFVTHSEEVSVVDGQGVSRVVKLALKANVKSHFNLRFQVFSVKGQLTLNQAKITVEYWASNPGSPSDAPTETFSINGDDSGVATALGRKSGWYRFTFARPDFENVSKPARTELPQYIDKGQAVTAYLKPVPFELTIQVKGYDVKQDKPDQPLSGMTVELEGLDWSDDRVVIPLVSETTNGVGEVTFKNLPPFRWRITVKRPGYQPKIEVVELTEINSANKLYNPQVLDVQLSPTEFKVELMTPYKLPDVPKGVVVQLKGVDESTSKGIERELIAAQAPDGEVNAIFKNLMPGKYTIVVKSHSYTFKGLAACEDHGLCGATDFNVRFHGTTRNIELDDAQNDFILIPLKPVPAVFYGKLVAHDGFQVGREFLFLEKNERLQWKKGRTIVGKSATGIQFIEHESVGLFQDDVKPVIVETDENGHFRVELMPGRYGIKIPSLTGYEGYNISIDGKQVGWPYPNWLTPTIVEPRFDRHGTWIHVSSDELANLRLMVHKHFVNVSWVLKPAGNDPFVFAVPFMMDSFQLEPLPGVAWEDLWKNGSCKLTGTTLTGTKVDETFPIVKDADTGQLICGVSELMPGNYEATATHPRNTFSPIEFQVKSFKAPGEHPNFQTWGTTAGVHQRLGSLQASFDATTAKVDVYKVNCEFDGTAGSYKFKMDSPDRALTQILIEPLDAGLGAITGKLYKLPPTNPLPPGSFNLYATWGELVNPGVDHRFRWAAFKAAGGKTRYIALRDKLDSEQKSLCPVNPAECSDGKTICVRKVTADDTPGKGMTFKVVIRTFTPAGLEIEGLTVEDKDSFDGLKLTSGVANATVLTGPISAHALEVSDPNWKTDFAVANAARPLGFEPGVGFTLEIKVWLKRSMTVAGKITLPDGSPAADTRVIILDRNGNWLTLAKTDEQGNYTSAKIDPQWVVVQALRRGYKPAFLCPAIDKKDPSISDANIKLELPPAPTIDTITFDRHGRFLAGVLKSGGNLLPFNTEGAKTTLTATWSVVTTGLKWTYTRPKWDNGTCPAGESQEIPVNDDVIAVYLVDRRVFDKAPLSDGKLQPADSVATPQNYDDWRALLLKLRDQAQKGDTETTPYIVLWSEGEREPGTTTFKGTLQIWNMPPGKLKAMFVAVTRSGAIVVKDYEAPDNRPVLEGLRLPKWAAFLTDILGSVAGFSGDVKVEDVMLPKGNLIPIPKGITATIVADSDGFLTYTYGMTVLWAEGQDGPNSGLFGFGPKKLGVSLEAGLEFKLEGGSTSKLSLGANGKLTLDMLKKYGQERPALYPGNKLVHIDKFEVSGSADLVNTAILPGSLDAGILPTLEMSSNFNVFVETAVRFDATPLISFLAKGIPHFGLAISAAVRKAKQAQLLEFYGILGAGFGVHAKKQWFTLYPVKGGSDATTPYVRNHFLGGTGSKFNQPITETGYLAKFNIGLSADMFRRRVRFDWLAQVGAPKGSSEPGLKLTFNTGDGWPYIVKVEGAVSMIFKASAKFGIISGSKTAQLDLLTIKEELGTEPVVSIVPNNESYTLVTPSTAPPATFVGTGGTILKNFYPSGSLALSGTGKTMLFTQTIPADGTMSLQVSARDDGGWSTPVTIASAGGFLGATIVELPDGRTIAIWSEIGAADAFNDAPSTTLKYAIADASGQWSEPKTISTSDETIHGLQVTQVGAKLVLAYFLGEEGISGTDQALYTATFENDSFSTPTELLAASNLTLFKLISGPGDKAAVALRRGDGTVLVLEWNGSGFDPEIAVTSESGDGLAAAYGSDGTLYLVVETGDGDLKLNKKAPNGQFSDNGLLFPGATARDLELLVLGDSANPNLVVSFTTNKTPSEIWVATFDAQGNQTNAPTSISADSETNYKDLLVRPTADSAVIQIIGKRDADSTEVVEFYVDTEKMVVVSAPGPVQPTADDPGTSDVLQPGSDTVGGSDTGGKSSGGGCQLQNSSSPSALLLLLFACLLLLRRRRLN